jgi:hypothetical protein
LSIPRIPEPARLIVSVLTPFQDIMERTAQVLIQELGPIEETVGPLAFAYTTYYDTEMGSGIRRWLWSFANLVDRAELARIKLLTNRVEQSYTDYGKRRVNLDPGLMTLGNFVLGTGKNNAHRIYLTEGIFADLTLIFRAGSYRQLEWTYPDYADPLLISILNRLRETYKCALQQENRPTAS